MTNITLFICTPENKSRFVINKNSQLISDFNKSRIINRIVYRSEVSIDNNLISFLMNKDIKKWSEKYMQSSNDFNNEKKIISKLKSIAMGSYIIIHDDGFSNSELLSGATFINEIYVDDFIGYFLKLVNENKTTVKESLSESIKYANHLSRNSEYEVVVSLSSKTEGYNGFIESRTNSEGCRFCGGVESESTSFRMKAHAFPESLGNKNLFNNDECDTCNKLFSKLESKLSLYLIKEKVSNGIIGKKPNPKEVFNEGYVRYCSLGKEFVIDDISNLRVIDSNTSLINFTSITKIQDKDIIKGLLKLVLSVSNRNSPYYNFTLNLLMDEMYEQFMPSVVRFKAERKEDDVSVTIYKKKERKGFGIISFAVINFCNTAFFIPLINDVLNAITIINISTIKVLFSKLYHGRYDDDIVEILHCYNRERYINYQFIVENKDLKICRPEQ